MFIHDEILRVGDRLRLIKSIHVFAGTYMKDSEFKVISFGSRGPTLIDEDGDTVIEAGFLTEFMDVWRGEWVPIRKRI